MNECVEITKMFVAETLGAGIGIGILLTLLFGLVGRYLFLYGLKKYSELKK